jgi:hypothetical protein
MIQVLGFNSQCGLGVFLFTTASRTALGPTQPPIQWVPGALSLGVKQLGCEVNHSHPSSVEFKECMELYFHSPNTPSWRGAQLKKEHRDNFTFTCLRWEGHNSTHWRMSNAYKMLVRKREGRDCLGDLGIDQRIIIKELLEK